MLRPLLWLLLGVAPAAPGETPPVEPAVPAGGVPVVELTAELPAASDSAGRAPEARTKPETQTWTGVLSVLGSRKIPLLGKVDFQTNTYVLAKATRSDAGWDVVQTTCRVAFPKTMGAQISIDPAALAKIPTSQLSWTISETGEWKAGPWMSGWDASDHDLDGEEGITLHIAAPFCGGDLYASSVADQVATGRPTDTAVVAGDISVHVVQTTLGTRGPCLRLMARDSDEVMDGKFVFQQATAGATCSSGATWPEIDF